MPLSVFAGFVPALDVSPLIPGSVDVTFRSINIGPSRVIILFLQISIIRIFKINIIHGTKLFIDVKTYNLFVSFTFYPLETKRCVAR